MSEHGHDIKTILVGVTEENIDVLGKWRFDTEFPQKFLPGSIVGNHPNYPSGKDWNYSYTNDWINEITFDQFRKYVLLEDIIENEPIIEDFSYLEKLFKELNIT